MKIDKQSLFWMSALTLFGFSGIGLLVISIFNEVGIIGTLFGGQSWYTQLSIGAGYGLFSAILALIIVRLPFFQSVSTYFQDIFDGIDFTLHDIIFYSFCAGVGEEILFRAGIQPFLGIWITAILFVALHGYLQPRSLAVSIYGCFLILISAGFGYLFEYIGLGASIVGHFTYDVIIFSYLVFYSQE